VGPIPDDLIDSWARLSSTLLTEAPMGELDLEAEHVDATTIREDEAVVAKQGRTKYNTAALDAAGEVVACTDIARTVHESDRAYQWGTLVDPRHRGHRLGLAVKVANLRLLQSDTGDARRLVTYNAEVNRHMIAVNDRLGFVPVARLGEFQKRLA
jgi:RimJ/RimL family protein N-acetyltransferase